MVPDDISSEKVSSLKQKAISGIIWGGISNFVQQLFALIVGIILSRLLSSEDYGMVSLLLIFSQIASSLQESGFISAIANKKYVTHGDYNAVFWAGIFISICLYSILFMIAPYIARFYDIPELTSLARLIFVGFLIGSTGIAHAAYLFKNLRVKERVISMTIAVALSGAIALVMAALGYKYWSLAIQSISYITVYTVMLWYFSDFRPTISIDFSPIRSLYKFSSKVFLSNIFQIININIYSVFVGKFYTKDNVGYLSQANKWSTMAQTFILSMNTNFTQPMLAGVEDDKSRQNRILDKLVSFTAFVSFPLMFGLGIVSQEFILLTITDKWSNSIPLLQIAAYGGSLFPLIHVFQSYILSRGKSDIYMKNIIGTGFLQLVLLGLLYPYGLVIIAWSLAATQLFSFCLWQFSVSKLQGLRLTRFIENISVYLCLAAFAATIAYILGNTFNNLYFKGIVKLGILSILYLGTVYLCKPQLIIEVWNGIKKRV